MAIGTACSFSARLRAVTMTVSRTEAWLALLPGCATASVTGVSTVVVSKARIKRLNTDVS